MRACRTKCRRCGRRAAHNPAKSAVLAVGAWLAVSSFYGPSLSDYEFGAGDPAGPGPAGGEGALQLPDLWSASAYRHPLVFRNRIMDPSGFAQESLDFITAMQQHFYIAVENDGPRYSAKTEQTRTDEARALLRRLADPARLAFVQSQPHIQIHLGAAGDFDCEPSGRVLCVGRTMFETDRLPEGWLRRINSQHQVWVPAEFNRQSFERSGIASAKLVVLPEPVDTALFDPDRPEELAGPPITASVLADGAEAGTAEPEAAAGRGGGGGARRCFRFLSMFA
eukprot:SAG22_NODE_3462_length_1698_cov_1.495310_1_plen_280_part_01